MRSWLGGRSRAWSAVFAVVAAVASAASLAACTPGRDAAEPRGSVGVSASASVTASPGGSAGATPGTATVVSRERVGERGYDLVVRSPVLGRKTPVRVLLPEGWRPGSGPWPVLYLLQGCCAGPAEGWVGHPETERHTARARMIVVVPEGGRAGFYSDWLDGPAWETYHIGELIPLIEREYGAGPRRAIAGFSMGGLGAMTYAARHPGMFQAAASYSGVLDTGYAREGLRELIRTQGEDPDDLWGDPIRQAAIWSAHNPAELTDALRGVRLYVSAGNGRPGPLDPPGARSDSESVQLRQSRNFAERARASGADLTTDFYGDGTHTWPYWARALERSLPLLREAIGA